MGAFTDMLLPDKGSGEQQEKVDQNDEGEPLPGTARHREFYPEGVADILQVSSVLCITWAIQLANKWTTYYMNECHLQILQHNALVVDFLDNFSIATYSLSLTLSCVMAYKREIIRLKN